MRVLVIGGTKFIGPPTVARLVQAGCEVTLFHRGQTATKHRPRILGDRREIAQHAAELRALQPDVVLDMIPMTEADGRGLVETFRGAAGRVVAISSADVYRAFGRVLNLEEGDVEPGPLAEDAPLRTCRHPYGGDYDKIPMEQTVLDAPDLPATVLRLPMVYGPGDPLHRMHAHLKRMDDGRPAIILDEAVAAWGCTHGFVDNVAEAIAAAVLDDHAAGRIYNVGDRDMLTTAEWVTTLARITGWDGRVVLLPAERCPPHLRSDSNYAQRVELDTRRIREELKVEDRVDSLEALRRTVEWERSQPPEPIDPNQFDYAAEDASLSGP